MSTALVVPPDREPWEKLPGESFKAFQAFALYRDLGPARSSQKVADHLSKSGTLIRGWASKWSWQVRAAAYDNHVDRRMREQQEDELARARRTWTAEGRALQHLGMSRLVGDPDNPEIQAVNPNTLDARDAAAVIRTGVEVEGKGLGDPLIVARSGGVLIPLEMVREFATSLVEIARRYIDEERIPAYEREVAAMRIGGER